MTKAVNQTFYYTVSNFIRYASSIFLLPIYTRWLTPSDYGTVELMTMLIDFVGLLVCNRIGESIYRYYKLAKSEQERKLVMSTSFTIGASLNFVGFLLLLAFSDYLSPLVSEKNDFLIIFIVFSFTLVLEAFNAIPLIFLKLQENARLHMYISIFKLVVQISLNILFVVVYEMHVTGVVLVTFISSAVIGAILTIILVRNNGISFSKDIAKKIARFSAPMVIVSLSSFAVVFGDRFFLKAYSSLSDVGIYSLSYRLAFAFTGLFWGPFYQYWQVKRYDVYKEKNAAIIFKDTFRRVNTYVLFFLLGYCLMLPLFVHIMTAEAFYDAAIYAPILTASLVLHMWSEFFSFSLFLKKRTGLLAKIEIFNAIFALGCYWLLIPIWGIKGAVLATILSYSFRLFLMYKLGQKLYRMNVEIGSSIAGLVICFAIVLIFQTTSANLYTSLGINSLITLIAYYVLISKYLGKRDFNLGLKVVKSKLNSIISNYKR